MKNISHTIGDALTSMGLLIAVMLLTISAMTFFSHALFMEVFPPTLSGTSRSIASWLSACAFESTLVIVTVNTKHLPSKKIPMLMAVCSGVIVLFFIDAFNFQQPPSDLMKKWFIGILLSTINAVFTELFYKKWSEYKVEVEAKQELVQLHARYVEMKREADDHQHSLEKLVDELTMRRGEIEQLRQFEKKIVSELTCQYCGKTQASYHVLNSHKWRCKDNIQKKPIKTNGVEVLLR